MGEGYDDLISDVRASRNSNAIYYTLIDASRIEAGLVLERSERRTAPGAAGE